MLERTPRYLQIWDTLTEHQKQEIVTKSVEERGTFNLYHETTERYVLNRYGKRRTQVVTK